MSQPVPHPHHISKLLQPALNGIVAALADRGGQTDAQYDARAIETWTLIQSFQPRDAIDLMLAGQLVAFNELFADGTRDVLRGMVDTMKQRTQSSLVAMGRLTLGQVDRLEKRGCQPYRTEVAAPQAEKPKEPAAQTPDAEPPKRPIAAARPASPKARPRPAASAPNPSHPPEPEPEPEPERQATAAEQPPAEASWLDEPYEEWVVETPADLAARTRVAQVADVLMAAADWDTGTGAARAGAPAEPVFPYQKPGNAPAPTLVDASGD